jgi:hypothetical protein
MRSGLVKGFAWVGCLAAAAAFAPNSQAASITAQLTCSLNILNSSGSCNNIGPFGTVKIDDTPGNGDLLLTVDLFNATPKFRDLMLNFAGTATTISSSDGQAELDPDGFSIAPYGGLFDVGESGGQGWNYSGTGPYITTLSGDVDLLLSDFMTLDSEGNLQVALHIQDIGSASGGDCDGSGEKDPCVPGKDGDGSLKIGGGFQFDDEVPDVPEPSTMLLMGGALLGLAMLRKKRNT